MDVLELDIFDFFAIVSSSEKMSSDISFYFR